MLLGWKKVICQETNHTEAFGSRRKDWPNLRWVDDIEADLKTLGMRGWRRKALDKNE
jgi:hypothetical protein